jgi:putative addiction module CopG family antidote
VNLTIPPDSQKFIEDRVKSGRYATPEDVVAAALRTLEDRETFADFEPTELDNLLEEGEQSIAAEGTLDGEEAFRLRRDRRAQGPKSV